MELKNIIGPCWVALAFTGCQKANDPSPLPENAKYLSQVIIYTEGAAADTTRIVLRHDQQGRYTGHDLFMHGNTRSAYDFNTTAYDGTYMISRLSIGTGSLSSYLEIDSILRNAEGNALARNTRSSWEDRSGNLSTADNRSRFTYQFESNGHYRGFEKSGISVFYNENLGAGQWVTNYDSSICTALSLNDNLASITIEGKARSVDSTRASVNVTRTAATHQIEFEYSANTPGQPVNPNNLSYAIFYPLHPFFFNGTYTYRNLPDRIGTRITHRDGNGNITSTDNRVEDLTYVFYASGYIKTLKITSNGSTVVYQYLFAED
jgi:hypothetical protein